PPRGTVQNPRSARYRFPHTAVVLRFCTPPASVMTHVSHGALYARYVYRPEQEGRLPALGTKCRQRGMSARGWFTTGQVITVGPYSPPAQDSCAATIEAVLDTGDEGDTVPRTPVCTRQVYRP